MAESVIHVRNSPAMYPNYPMVAIDPNRVQSILSMFFVSYPIYLLGKAVAMVHERELRGLRNPMNHTLDSIVESVWERPSKVDRATAQSISTGLYDSMVDLVHDGAYLPSPIPSTSSTSSVAVYLEGGDHIYQLMEDDIFKVFSRFGPIQSVNLSQDLLSAVVVFASATQAEYAIAKLNGKLVQASLVLRVVPWNQSSPNMTPTIPIVRKYTCRFDIQIDNDKEFHVARRIIGQKGANMKRIVKQAGYDAKLRLRGRGSGFLEGAQKQESQEPLHLCVSCKDYAGYKAAIEQVEELLSQVYDEYRDYCAMRNQLYPQNLSLVIHEHPLMYHQPVSVYHSMFPPTTSPERNESLISGGDEEIESLIEQRNEARRMCNFKEADRIRDLLRLRGIGLMDEPGGRGRGTEVTTWRYWRS